MKKALLTTLTAATMLLSADYTNSIGMKFKEIPAGSFVMGTSVDCPKDNPFTKNNEHEDCLSSNNVSKDETPAHTVNVKSFFMGETEVTQGQWYEVMGQNPAYYQNGNPNMPVEQVSWDDAKEFVKRLNAKEKTTKYALPTEAQWEYAVRAGTTTKWSCGDNESCLDSVAWYNTDKPRPVAIKQPNVWGLYDMHGNVYEWTEDCWSSTYGSSKDCSRRSYRGGSYSFSAGSARSADRDNYAPDNRSNVLGLRLLRTK